ncbi:MAG: GNAT family N-acetyltransferase [Oscillospiraceae bacterium]|nr:GNAT family N-acetyltransferase [Oscillospiraceae bacterium]
MSITIEKATCADAAEILRYLKQIGAETDNLTFGAEGLPFTTESEAAYIRQMENSCDAIMLLAKENGKIVGDASLSRLPRRMKHRGDLGVSVLKEYWNRGIGSQLLLEIINFAKENAFEVIDLQVRSDNLPAIHLYEKFGFKKIGMHPVFFKIGDEEIAFDYMCLKLQ